MACLAYFLDNETMAMQIFHKSIFISDALMVKVILFLENYSENLICYKARFIFIVIMRFTTFQTRNNSLKKNYDQLDIEKQFFYQNILRNLISQKNILNHKTDIH